jgi:PAS domain S-box-containing protein
MPTDLPFPDHAARAEREHAELVAVLEELLIHGGAGVIATDLEGVITHWTAGAARLYGWSADEAIGQSVHELLAAPGDRSIAAANMESMRSTGVWEGEFDVRTKEGGVIPAYVRTTLIKDDAGRAVGLLGMSMEVSS